MITKNVDRASGPAFPVSLKWLGDAGWRGMTLRDWFAGRARIGLCAGSPGSRIGPEMSPQLAYDHADAMLARRAE